MKTITCSQTHAKLATYLGAVTFKTSRTQASSMDGSSTVCDIVTPTLAQNKLMASGGIPRLFNAVKVNKRGSSPSATALLLINLPILRLETTAQFRFKRLYSHWTGQQMSTALHSQQQDDRRAWNSLVHNECVMCSMESHRQ